MIIKLTLFGLIIALIAIVAASYYVNKEGFDNITSQTLNTCTGDCNNTLNASNNVCRAVTQSDGNYVIYDSANKPMWASNTYGKGSAPYKTVMQTDGNLVLYDKNNKPTWASNTAGKGMAPYRLVMQDDCNLVVYDKNNQATWASKSNPVTPGLSYTPAAAPLSASSPTPATKPATAPVSPAPMSGPAPSTTTISVSKSLPDSKAAPVTMGGVASTQMGAPLLNSVIPERHDVVPQVALSESGYKAMELQQRSDLLKDIQKVVKNELLAARSTEQVISDITRDKITDSMVQGQEYEKGCYKENEVRCPKNPDGTCPPVPDMSKYIKKDEIPCYGCTLDY